jgi:hypothetical protein
MKITTVCQTLCVAALSLFAIRANAAEPQAQAASPMIGELREFALPDGNATSRAQLHQEGWIEADGRLLESSAFQPLFKAIGRSWTPATVSSDEFALPDLRNRSRRQVSSDNPYGVLGPGDLVTSGRPAMHGLSAGPITYWIFVGQDASGVDRHQAR